LIADADADGTIQLLGFEQTITSTIDESGGVAITFKHTDSDGLTNDTYLAEFIHANDGDAQAHFMRGLDNNTDELWKIDYAGVATFKSVDTSGSDTPGFTANDLQNPGADLEIGKLYWNYLSGADGAEDGGVYLQTMIAGTERTVFEYDADTEVVTLGDSATGEDLAWDFDGATANVIDVASNSGVTKIDFAFIVQATQLISDIPDGTAPLLVTSLTKVLNLNVDQVDGESASEIVTAARVGAVSASLDDTDASVEWEDAADLDASGEVADDSHNHVITNIDSFTKANLETQTSDVSDYAEADGDVFTGVHDFGGATTFEIWNSTSDMALGVQGQIGLQVTDDQLVFHGGAAGEIQGEAALSLLEHFVIVVDPAWAYDQESTYRTVPIMWVGDDFPEGFTMTEWRVNYVGGDPTTELDADIMCDTTPDFNPATNATVMDVIDTTAGAATADTGFDSGTCANGSRMYIRFGADPTDANVVIALDIWGYAEED
jgi:hypothetical protein